MEQLRQYDIAGNKEESDTVGLCLAVGERVESDGLSLHSYMILELNIYTSHACRFGHGKTLIYLVSLCQQVFSFGKYT